VERLLYHGANPNARDVSGQSPLHIAARDSTTEYTKLLIAHGASTRLRDNELRTPFMEACRSNEPNAVLLMDPDMDVRMVDRWGQSALHLVVQQASVKLFHRFIELGWDPYLKDITGQTPISTAAGNGAHFATYIRASMPEADQSVETLASFTEYQRAVRSNKTLRHLCRRVSFSGRQRCLRDGIHCADLFMSDAAAFGDIERMDILLQAGANLESFERYCGTPLVMACTVGQLSAVRYLVRRGANLHSALDGTHKNAVQAARDNPHVVAWILVGRYTEYLQLTSTASGPVSDKELRPWSGIRQIEIALIGRFARADGESLLDMAMSIHSTLSEETWTALVPLNWNPLPHMVPLPSEIRLAESERLFQLYGRSYMVGSRLVLLHFFVPSG
jgi:hypothetical protein